MNGIIALLAFALFLALLMGIGYLNHLIINKLHPKGISGFLFILLISLLVNIGLLGLVLFFSLSGGSDGGPIIAVFGTIVIGVPLALSVAISSLCQSKSPTPEIPQAPLLSNEENFQ